jgi:hypothetical protein
MIALPVIDAVAGVFKGLFGVVDQLVEDKDKKNEIFLKMAEMQNQLNIVLMQLKTVPWVDATVKLLFAFRDLVLPLLRPVVGALMTGYAAYAETNGINLSPVVQAALAAAFPGWMYSRHTEKRNGTK